MNHRYFLGILAMFTLFTAACGAMDPEQISMEETTGSYTIEEKILVEALDSDSEADIELTASRTQVELTAVTKTPAQTGGQEGPNPGVFKDPKDHTKGVVVEGIFESPGISAPQDEPEISDTLSANVETEREEVREDLDYAEVKLGYADVEYTFEEEEDCDPEDC